MMDPRRKQLPQIAELRATVQKLVIVLNSEKVRQALEGDALSKDVRTETKIGAGFECLLKVQILQRIGFKHLYFKEMLLDVEIRAKPNGMLDVWDSRDMKYDVAPANFIERLARILSIKEQAHDLERVATLHARYADNELVCQLLNVMDAITTYAANLQHSRLNTWLRETKTGFVLDIEVSRLTSLFGRIEIVGSTQTYELTVPAVNCILIVDGATGEPESFMSNRLDPWLKGLPFS